jgi:hypothetical protein
MKALYIIMILLTIIFAKELSLDLDVNKTIIENSDSLNFCLAVSEKDLKYCSKIKNKDEKSSCFGILQRNSGHCTMIGDEDMKNSCLSIALSDIKYCEQITDEKMKNSCTVFYVKNESDKKQDTCIE